MADNALEAHALDELGITDALSARPIQAALIAAGKFWCRGRRSLAGGKHVSQSPSLATVGLTSLVLLVLGGAARPPRRRPASQRCSGASCSGKFWAMSGTTGVGLLFGTTV